MKSIFVLLIILLTTLSGKAQEDNKVNLPAPTDSVLTLAEVMPEYPGGMKELYTFIATQIKFPESCLKDKAFTDCKVFVKFIVDLNGYPTAFEVIKGCAGYPECDEEALRVLKLMPRWEPGKMKGKPVNVYFNLPIRFKK